VSGTDTVGEQVDCEEVNRLAAEAACERIAARERADAVVAQADAEFQVHMQCAGEPLVSRSVHVDYQEGSRDTTELTHDPLDFEQPEPGQPGVRTANVRFPQIATTPQYLFHNSAANIASGKAMRDKYVGNPCPVKREREATKNVLGAFLQKVFTPAAIRHYSEEYDGVAKKLPSKWSQLTRDKVVYDSLAGTFIDGKVDVFVKAEVTSKAKPRTVVNHGPQRVVGLAKCAWLFEKVLFSTFGLASIKGRKKSLAISETFANFSRFEGQTYENDFSSFEYGISAVYKQLEVTIMKHIIEHAGIDCELSAEFVCRVIDERTKATKWTFKYKDEAGQSCTFTFKLDRPIRESGDRLTSSGNWYQNLEAWIEMLVHKDDVLDFVVRLIDAGGGPTQFRSARDGFWYWVCFNFEGDDTVLKTDEKIKVECPRCTGSEDWKDPHSQPSHCAQCFFLRRGFKPKLRICSSTGSDFVRYVGFDVLHKDGYPVYEGNELVMIPEIKRCLTTKSWTLTKVSETERNFCEYINAGSMANANVLIEPMHAFWLANYNRFRDKVMKGSGNRSINDNVVSVLQDTYIRETGEVGTKSDMLKWLDSFEVQPYRGTPDHNYRELARVSAGEVSKEEWALMCGITEIPSHGLDLRTQVPLAWYT
jgi:hypothetical protein